MQIRSQSSYQVAAINRAFDNHTGEYTDSKVVLTLESEDGTMASMVVDQEHHPQVGDKFELTLTPTTVVQKTS